MAENRDAQTESAEQGIGKATKPIAVLTSLQGYQRGWLRGDLAAGLAIAAVGLPSAIAYPAIAGLPQETGIYASIASAVGYAVFGPSRRLIVGPDAATIAVLAGVLATVVQAMPAGTEVDRAGLAALISIIVGLTSIAASMLKLGNLSSLLSRPILVGFFVGVALSIIMGQLGKATGVPITAEGVFAPVTELWTHGDLIHLPSLLLSLGMLAVLQLCRWIRFAIPGPLVVVVVSLILSGLCDFEGMGIRILGALPTAIPAISVPRLSGLPIRELLLGSAAVFVISFGAGIITARGFAVQTRDAVDANAELTGFGAANIISGLFGGFAVTSSDSRTAVNLAAGGRSQLAGLTAALVLLTAVVFFGGTLRLLPIPALAVILMSAAFGVIDFGALRQIWRISRIEFAFALIAMIGAIGFGVLQGVAIALAATFVYVTLNAMQPRVVLLGRIPGRPGFYKLHRHPETRPVPGLAICFVQGNLLFFDADHVRLRMLEIIADLAPDTRWLVIEASAISQIDTTGLDMLDALRTELSRHHVRLGFCELQADVAKMLDRSGLAQSLGQSMFFEDMDDALIAFEADGKPADPMLHG